jgi:hypothetical protein
VGSKPTGPATFLSANSDIKELTVTRIFVDIVHWKQKECSRRTLRDGQVEHYKRTIIFGSFHWKRAHALLAKLYNPERPLFSCSNDDLLSKGANQSDDHLTTV